MPELQLEGMFKDAELSAELMVQFEASRAAATHAASKSGSALPAICDLSVHVLTSSNWPAYTPAPVILPPEVAQYAWLHIL